MRAEAKIGGLARFGAIAIVALCLLASATSAQSKPSARDGGDFECDYNPIPCALQKSVAVDVLP